MKSIVEIIIKKIKSEDSYQIKLALSKRELFHVIILRIGQIIRGFSKRFKFRKISGLFFCGHKVRVEFGYKIISGKNLILEDNVFINAFSINGIILGNNVTIAKGSILQCTGVVANKGLGIIIGNNSALGAQSYLGGQGGIKIGDNVIMGPGIKIFSENHNYSDANELIRKQGENRKGVLIKNNCWIGANTTIVDGVEIEEGCIIAAGSVVTKSIPQNSIAAGVPAKVIKSRIDKNII